MTGDSGLGEEHKVQCHIAGCFSVKPCGNQCLRGMPGVQDADREALRNMEDTAKEVSGRVDQLAADREELAQAAGKTRADLAAARESLTAKKAALEKAMDANRRNGCIANACSCMIPHA